MSSDKTYQDIVMAEPLSVFKTIDEFGQDRFFIQTYLGDLVGEPFDTFDLADDAIKRLEEKGVTRAQVEREQLQLASVRDWARERQERADAYAAVLTYLNAAADAAPYDNGTGTRLSSEITFLAGNARGSLRRVLNETNPFVANNDPALREAAASILRDAEEAGVGDWDTARMVEFYSGTRASTRRRTLAQMIDVLRGERKP